METSDSRSEKTADIYDCSLHLGIRCGPIQARAALETVADGVSKCVASRSSPLAHTPDGTQRFTPASCIPFSNAYDGSKMPPVANSPG